MRVLAHRRGGAPSEVYPIYRAIVDAASISDLVTLLSHPSPVVRAYMSQAILERAPEEYARLFPLLADREPMASFCGCGYETADVATFVARDLTELADLGATPPAVVAKILAALPPSSSPRGVHLP